MATGEGGGDWRGSVVSDETLAQLRLDGVLGTEDEVKARVPPEDEIRPDPRRGEVVLFVDHLERGLALPVSPFFCQFLEFFNLQLHHLGANSIA